MRKILLAIVLVAFLTSCSIFKSNKTGCPTNGRAVGAEKLAAGDPKSVKAANKAPKFKF
ncbi:MAG: lipoprotein [Chitinophagaceae bacterium]|nr:lipoprotein [Chitinophagaceae bacterium]